MSVGRIHYSSSEKGIKDVLQALTAIGLEERPELADEVFDLLQEPPYLLLVDRHPLQFMPWASSSVKDFGFFGFESSFMAQAKLAESRLVDSHSLANRATWIQL